MVSVLREGYTLPFKQRPWLIRYSLVQSGYANPVKNRFLKETIQSNEQVCSKKGDCQVVSGFLRLTFPCPQTKQKMETNPGSESVELVPQCQYIQDGNPGVNPVALADRGMGHIAGLQ